MQQSLGKTIRKYRHLKGYSIADLSKKLNISTGFISNIETGKGDPFQLSVLNSIIEELNIPVNEIQVFDLPASKMISASKHTLTLNLEFLNLSNQKVIVDNLDNLLLSYFKTIARLETDSSIEELTKSLIFQLNVAYLIKSTDSK